MAKKSQNILNIQKFFQKFDKIIQKVIFGKIRVFGSISMCFEHTGND